MDKPQIIRINPLKIDDEIQGPVVRNLVEKGWTVATSIILEDPRAAEGDRHRLALVMFPPMPSAGAPGSRLFERVLAVVIAVELLAAVLFLAFA